jgi:uncharacterized protein
MTEELLLGTMSPQNSLPCLFGPPPWCRCYPAAIKPAAYEQHHHHYHYHHSMTTTVVANTEWKNPLKGWYNKPDKKVVIKDNKIIMKVPIGTDCWLKTKQGLLQQGRTINNAPFHWQKVEGQHFIVVVKVSGSSGLTDDGAKAGLMVRLDEDHYIFTGMEYYQERVHHSTAVALEKSDWCIAPLPVQSERAGVWFQFVRIGNAYECRYSLDNVKWVVTRQGYFTNEPILYVGISCACPGRDEFRATFESYECTVSEVGPASSAADQPQS